MSDIEISYNAGRICEAIAKIGYEPHTAIMDIVDNSVTASARNVIISLNLAEGKSLKSRNSVISYVITDDGAGMDDEGIKNAFSIGSDKSKYSEKSLSKYGMGLKSAGLSLGSRIVIISKIDNVLFGPFIFDSIEIRNKNKFFISKGIMEHYSNLIDTYFNKTPSGTTVIIEGCENVNQASPKLTTEKLKKRLGVTYFSFLKTIEPLNINLRITPHGQDPNNSSIIAKDMLFIDSEDFKTNYNPDSYDYVSPYLALNDPWVLTDLKGQELPPITIKAVVFPQATLAGSKSPLPKESKSKITEYEISRENKGFFIYRNGRLIRWGDDLDGVITKDDINLRIRMDLSTEHDDVLHVDVTKQRLEIDDENKSKLQGIVNKALITAKTVRNDCQSYLKSTTNDEGLAFNSTVENVSEDDPEEISSADPEFLERRKLSAADGEIAKSKLAEDNPDKENTKFRKIIYSTKITYGKVWEPFYDATEGVFVGINKIHPYYTEFLSRYQENSIERIVAEALIFSVGLAESNVRDHFVDVDRETINQIFKKFHKNIENWLAEWSTDNINLVDE
ncbi:ATP-binding protein [Methylomonas rosea]|uniref:ATP-binding protein n=1 Tax=Methylomonas rosea TaxID=2952227 RepID=A0ABT1TUG5_9GAMM|nr:ATP-binding protein [Methylomonas sp. WSC-7]MCQ8118423.1 ATP-binding protein [Methylomonas sp. WSC-7]